jgi:hypothetical protein
MNLQKISVDTVGAGFTAVDTQTFSMDQAELDFKLNLGKGLTAQVDLQAGAAASAATTTLNNIDNVELEQARVDYTVGPWTFTGGKFDTFVGLEGLEPVDLFQYSHSLTYELAPTQHTGVAVKYNGGMFSFDGAIVNSATSISNPDTNDQMGFVAHIGLTPYKAWAFNLSYGTSDEGAAGAATSTDVNLLAADIQYNNYGWTVGFEYAKQEVDVGVASMDSTAYMLMANYEFNEQFSITARYSANKTEVAGANSGDMTEITIAPSYAFTPNWLGVLEYRAESTDATYNNSVVKGLGGGGADATSIALESIISF